MRERANERDIRAAVRVSQLIGSNARRELTMRDVNQASCESNGAEGKKEGKEGSR